MTDAEVRALAQRIVDGDVKANLKDLSNAEFVALGYNPHNFGGLGYPSYDEVLEKVRDILFAPNGIDLLSLNWSCRKNEDTYYVVETSPDSDSQERELFGFKEKELAEMIASAPAALRILDKLVKARHSDSIYSCQERARALLLRLGIAVEDE